MFVPEYVCSIFEIYHPPAMSSAASRNVVRSIVGHASEPLTSRQIFQIALSKYPGATSTSNIAAPSLSTAKKTRNGSLESVQIQTGKYVHSLTYENFHLDTKKLSTYTWLYLISQLKRQILPDLESKRVIEKLYFKRPITNAELEENIQLAKKKAARKGRSVDVAKLAAESQTIGQWGWRLHSSAKELPIPATPSETEVLPYIEKVDKSIINILHRPSWVTTLNRRRARARPRKIATERKWIRDLAAAKSEGRAEAAKLAAASQ